MTTKTTKLSKSEKERIANRINYFRVMPAQILKTASDLENGIRGFTHNLVTHEIKSVLVGGRIMLLRVH
jgi:hypothetical protein